MSSGVFSEASVCVAHNASFDAGFYHAEMARVGLVHERAFICTISRPSTHWGRPFSLLC